MSTALVHNQHGAPMGIDWRRSQGTVPGRIAAEHVMPGDGIRVARAVPTVLWTRTGRVVQICIRTEGGAEIVLERTPGEFVEVVDVGRFDPVSPTTHSIADDSRNGTTNV